MTTKNGKQQRARQLQRLQQDYDQLKQEIVALGHVVPGSVQKREYRCGKPNCRCMTEGILHGPYYQWTRKIRGTTVNINLEKQAAITVQEWIRNNRKLRKLCSNLEKKSLAMLKIIANLRKI
jgi:hypothetical protein